MLMNTNIFARFRGGNPRKKEEEEEEAPSVDRFTIITQNLWQWKVDKRAERRGQRGGGGCSSSPSRDLSFRKLSFY